MRVIYDLGAHNGDDVTYYLKKAERVVAVEADPALAEEMRERFAKEIAAGRLVIENYVVTTTSSGGEVPFYVHQGHSVLSQAARPDDTQMGVFKELRLPTKRIMDIVGANGAPYYIKIDLEGLDGPVLRELFAHGVFPPYLSAESHGIDIFCILVASGMYPSFKLMDGQSVGAVYSGRDVETDGGRVHHHFPGHCAGPFGNDIIGPWESAETFFKTLADAGLGWKDIHVSRLDAPER